MADLHYATSRDGTRIAFRTVGNGEPIVFVHGTGTTGADWVRLIPFLRERFTVVTMDRRGRGDSGDAAEYAMPREADDVSAVLQATGADLLVAHSYGALCSVLAAERLDHLRRLVLYEPPIAVKADFAGVLDELVDQGRRDAALESFLTGAGASPEELETIRSSPAWPVLLDAVPTVPRELRAATEWRHPSGSIDVPLLFLLGAETEDPVYLDGLEDLHAAFADCRSETLAGQRHIGHLFAPERFATLVADFCA